MLEARGAELQESNAALRSKTALLEEEAEAARKQHVAAITDKVTPAGFGLDPCDVSYQGLWLLDRGRARFFRVCQASVVRRRTKPRRSAS